MIHLKKKIIGHFTFQVLSCFRLVYQQIHSATIIDYKRDLEYKVQFYAYFNIIHLLRIIMEIAYNCV